MQARTSVSFGGARETVSGLCLRATDADLVIGSGTEVTGTVLALLLAVSGRPVRPGELVGPGAAVLARAE
ncbi:hypothetical protein [Pseudonocardia sp. HH130629-09]|uniref:hypothetical protein n=1 Tax=Pseudonocardia sp. HH130629-09 TaxID=1641402 RepID=UPI000761A5D5|nr:hypothetical protein [Pseudonocardia sp. HH130629-09]